MNEKLQEESKKTEREEVKRDVYGKEELTKNALEQENKEKEEVERQRLEKALEILRDFVCALAAEAGENAAYGETLWQGILQSEGLLQELAYYHDYGSFLCRYEVAGYTLADVLAWQVDHFKLYMDRPEEMNRYRQPRLLLAAFGTMLQMEKNPERFAEKMRSETGQDIV